VQKEALNSLSGNASATFRHKDAEVGQVRNSLGAQYTLLGAGSEGRYGRRARRYAYLRPILIKL
jgi:TolB-like protein